MKYIPQSQQDQKKITELLGISSADEVFADVPQELRVKGVLDYPKALSEMEVRKHFQSLAETAELPQTSFAGAGIYQHYIPSIVPTLLNRSEFATAYTPYQPEISQGTLQAIFEYQTLAAQLTEMEISNASLYDGATSLAEAILMGLRIQRKSSGKILISDLIHPFYRQVVDIYCSEFKDRFETLESSGDQISFDDLKSKLGSADLVVTQSPNIFGVVENYPQLGKLVKASEALWITSTMEPVSWGLLRGPGAYGAHIVTGEGQSFGNAPYLGGSTYGIFCSRQEYVRNLPGRLVGETVDRKGRRSYTLTFATREQFIRREKATSNICTNHNLNMLGGLIHLSVLGKKGVRELALQNHSMTEAAKAQIKSETSFAVSDSPTFNEFVVEVSDAKVLVEKASAQGWVCGVDLGRFKESWKSKLLIHLSELHNKNDIQKLVNFLKQEA